MHPATMKHKASLWDGEYGTSGHITDVHCEGDITQEELIDVADQITSDWQIIDLELDRAHPCHGQVFRLCKFVPDLADATSESQKLQAELELAGQYVWVHCSKHVVDPLGDMVDDSGQTYRQVFNTIMFCTEFVSFDDLAQQCNDNFGKDDWSEYELFLDDDLPTPVASYG